MSEKTPRLLKVRSCYGHIGGTLGNRLLGRLLELGWIEQDGNKATVFSLTELGEKEFEKLGVDIYEKR